MSGTANGADRLGERFASKYNLKLSKFPADWNTYGKRAGYIRNQQMSEYADALVLFWNGTSNGSKHMLDIATKDNLIIKVVKYKQ